MSAVQLFSASLIREFWASTVIYFNNKAIPKPAWPESAESSRLPLLTRLTL